MTHNNVIFRNTYFRYLLVGGLTTAVSFGSYFFFRSYLSLNISISTVLSWITATLFAYISNKKFVFGKSTGYGWATIIELFYFYFSRISTGFLELSIMTVFVDWLNLNEVFFKLFTNVLVIILNFILSKYYVFKSK